MIVASVRELGDLVSLSVRFVGFDFKREKKG